MGKRGAKLGRAGGKALPDAVREMFRAESGEGLMELTKAMEWRVRNKDMLRERYKNEFILYNKDGVIAHGKSHEGLIRKRERMENGRLFQIEFIYGNEPSFLFAAMAR